MNTPLQQAAQELIDRWDSPMWRYQQATTDVIAELRKALDAEISQTETVDRNLRVTELAQSVEPVATVESIMANGRPFISRLPGARLQEGDSLYLHPPQKNDGDLSLTYAKSLAVWLAKTHYTEAIGFELLGDMYGVLSQIDNMITDMQRKQPPKPQATTPVPEGYVLVPIEATPAMDNAYRKSPCRDLSGLWHEIITAAQGEKP